MILLVVVLVKIKINLRLSLMRMKSWIARNMIFYIKEHASDWWLIFSKIYSKRCSKAKRFQGITNDVLMSLQKDTSDWKVVCRLIFHWILIEIFMILLLWSLIHTDITCSKILINLKIAHSLVVIVHSEATKALIYKRCLLAKWIKILA